MIFRAIFWIGVVSLLMPREPDLGLGRPSLGGGFSGGLGGLTWPSTAAPAAARAVAGTSNLCSSHAEACAGGLAVLDSFQNQAVRGLAQIKAEIEESRKQRERASPL